MSLRQYTYRVEYMTGNDEVYDTEYVEVEARNDRQALKGLKEEVANSAHAYEGVDARFRHELVNEIPLLFSRDHARPGYDDDGYRL